MDRLVVTPSSAGGTLGPSCVMVGYDMERRGRTKSFVVSGLVALVVFPLQTLPWLVSTGRLPSRIALAPFVSARMSLLFDFLFLGSLAFHAFSARGLVWMDTRRPRQRPRDDVPIDHARRKRRSMTMFLVILGCGWF